MKRTARRCGMGAVWSDCPAAAIVNFRNRPAQRAALSQAGGSGGRAARRRCDCRCCRLAALIDCSICCWRDCCELRAIPNGCVRRVVASARPRLRCARPAALRGARPAETHGVRPAARHGARSTANRGARSTAMHGVRLAPGAPQADSTHARAAARGPHGVYRHAGRCRAARWIVVALTRRSPRTGCPAVPAPAGANGLRSTSFRRIDSPRMLCTRSGARAGSRKAIRFSGAIFALA